MNVVRIHLIKVIISFITQEFRGNHCKALLNQIAEMNNQKRELAK